MPTFPIKIAFEHILQTLDGCKHSWIYRTQIFKAQLKL